MTELNGVPTGPSPSAPAGTAPPASAPAVPAQAWPALWAMVIGFFMILVDSTIVSVATPAIMRAFGADINGVLWVTSAYLLAYAVPLLITGRLGDRLGPKRVYLAGLVVFTLSSLACGLSPSLAALVVARTVQGLGASMMTPQTMAVITRTFPPQHRGQAMALWGATAGVAMLVGPLLGGVLIDRLGWEWIFFVNVPVGLVALAAAARLVPRLETHSHSFDLVGVALSAVGLFCLVFGIQEGETYSWGQIAGPISVPLLIAVGLVVLGAFVWWQARHTREPLVPLELFRDRNFSVSNLAISSVGFAITAMVFPFMLYAQVVRGLSPTSAALLMAPQALAVLVLAPVVGRLVDRHNPRILAGAGMLGMPISILLLSRVMTPDAQTWQILLVALALGVSSAFVWGPLSTAANRNLPMRMAGAGAGVYNTMRQIGSVVGSAAIAVLMESRLAVNLPGVGTTPRGTTTGALPAAIAEPFATSLAQSMLLPAGVLLIGWVAVLFYEPLRHLVARPADTPVETPAQPSGGSPSKPSPGSAVSSR